MLLAPVLLLLGGGTSLSVSLYVVNGKDESRNRSALRQRKPGQSKARANL